VRFAVNSGWWVGRLLWKRVVEGLTGRAETSGRLLQVKPCGVLLGGGVVAPDPVSNSYVRAPEAFVACSRTQFEDMVRSHGKAVAKA
jgi:hypothetical protein